MPETALSTAAFISEVFSLDLLNADISSSLNFTAINAIIGITASTISASHGFISAIIISAPIMETIDKNTSSGPW